MAKNNLAKILYDYNDILEELDLNIDEKPIDEVIEFCKNNPSYEFCINKYGEKILEYEIDGKIKIENSIIKIL